MAIDIRQYSLLPVRRDKQNHPGSTAGISAAGGGSSSSSSVSGTFLPIYKDSSVMIYWESSTNSVRFSANVFADGEVAAWTAAPTSPSWLSGLMHEVSFGPKFSWSGGYLTYPEYLRESSLGTGFTWNGVTSKYDVSGGGGTGDVTKAYVDGSLSTRDTSIYNLGVKNSNQDTSLNSIWTKLGSVDTSLNNLGVKNTNQDTSLNNLGIKNANQDTSLNSIWTKLGSVDTSLNKTLQKNSTNTAFVMTLPMNTQDASLLFYYEVSTNALRVNANLYASGEVAAFTAVPTVPNWSAGFMKEASFGPKFSWVGGYLDVCTGAGSGSQWITSGSNIYYDTGNVGIGTITPTFPLSFAATTGDKIALYDNNAGIQYGFGIQSNLLQIYCDTATDRVGIGYGTSGSFTETLTVKGTNVGIGETAPNRMFVVNSASNQVAKITNGYYNRGIELGVTADSMSYIQGVIHNSDAPYYLNLNPNGYGVAIGKTTNATAMLDVAGYVRFASSAGTYPWELRTSAGANEMYLYEMTGSTGPKLTLTSGGQLQLSATTGTAPISVSSTTVCPNLNAAMVDGYGASSLAKRYSATVTLSSTYAKIARIYGGGLASGYRVSFTGTGDSIVVNAVADILVNHYKDITIKSFSGAYSTVTLRITSDDNSDHYLEAKINSANSSPIICVVMPFGAETVIMTPASVSGSSVLEHVCSRQKLAISNYDGDGGTVGGITSTGKIAVTYADLEFGQWIHTTTGNTYLDNTKDDSSYKLFLRMRTNGTPLYAFTACGTGYNGVGTDSPTYPFHVYATPTDRGIACLTGAGTAGTYLQLDEAGIKGWAIGMDNGSSTFRIKEDSYAGTTAFSIAVGGVATFAQNIIANANINCYGEVTAYYSSDERLKTNIKSFTALDIIKKLPSAKTYKWNEKAVSLNPAKDTSTQQYGLIAQEVLKTNPELVHKIYEDYLSIDYVQLIPILLQGMKELNTKVNNLEKELNYYKNERYGL
jgi:hypothetical protein